MEALFDRPPFYVNHWSKICFILVCLQKDKIMRWRTELSSFDFDIVYRCGEKNIPADALSRFKCLSMSTGKLRDVHESLCHPGETRMAHFVKVRNFPFSDDQGSYDRTCLRARKGHPCSLKGANGQKNFVDKLPFQNHLAQHALKLLA